MSEEKVKPPFKCKIKAGNIQPCSMLSDMIVEKGRGLRLNKYLEMPSGARIGKAKIKSRSCIVSYHPPYMKGGLVINHCPMCGVKIAEHMK